MPGDKKQSAENRTLTFFGVITASVTHELNNVLSIVTEYTGLLEDLLTGEEQGRPQNRDRFRKITQNISEQLKREKEIIKLLNRFSHRVDTPLLEFNINEHLTDIVRLSHRFASLKKVNLHLSLPDEQLFITSSPFDLQYCVFKCIELALECSNPEDSIGIKLNKVNDKIIISLKAPTLMENESMEYKMAHIVDTIRCLGGEFKFPAQNDETENSFALIIPF